MGDAAGRTISQKNGLSRLRHAVRVGGAQLPHGGLDTDAEEAYQPDRIGGDGGFVQDPVGAQAAGAHTGAVQRHRDNGCGDGRVPVGFVRDFGVLAQSP
ncbi:hypothetical protein ACQEVZ_06665 [Dactylosporangium sp. CA-152071]|uniref:hypothetical protein n=1 Tax=Dactylosporangium sp. CA-152071 TaxID=3239933 RepID=UPI003D8F222A